MWLCISPWPSVLNKGHWSKDIQFYNLDASQCIGTTGSVITFYKSYKRPINYDEMPSPVVKRTSQQLTIQHNLAKVASVVRCCYQIFTDIRDIFVMWLLCFYIASDLIVNTTCFCFYHHCDALGFIQLLTVLDLLTWKYNIHNDCL